MKGCEIKITGLEKSYGEKQVLKNIDVSIESGEILAVMGESGSGKTTFLRCVCALCDYMGNIERTESGISFIFQEDRLIPNLTAAANIEYVLKGDKAEKRARAEAALTRARLENCAHLYPSQLSGGMARRVSMARAFAFNAPLLVMDEPFGGLDLKLKNELLSSFKEMWGETKPTVLFVTHSPFEAMSIASRIIILAKGGIVFDEKAALTSTEKLIDLLTKN